MAPVELDVRVFDELARLLGEFDPVVPEAALAELSALAPPAGSGASREATAARVGRDLAERCRVVPSDAGNADDALVALAREGAIDYAVTTDRELADRLLAAGVPVVGVRGRNALAVTEP